MAWDDIVGPGDVVPSADWNDMIHDQKNRLNVFGMERYDGSPDGGTSTTGDISDASDELTVASASTFKVNQGILVVGAIADYTDTGNTDDTDEDFSTTGGEADREWMARKFTASATGIVGAITARLGKTGTPAGTIRMSIYSDDGGSPSKPSVQIGGDSDTVSCNALNADAGGADQIFKWSSGFPQVAASTAYWIVLKTTGYTYEDGVTEVRWRTDADGASGLNECAKYDSNASPEWTIIGADVGADAVVDLCLVSTISTIVSILFTLADSATKTVSGAIVQHDEVNSITTAHTAATIIGGILYFPPGTYNVKSGNITINSDVSFAFASGAKLNIDKGVTVTINGPIAAGKYEIFDGTGTIAGTSATGLTYSAWFSGTITNNITGTILLLDDSGNITATADIAAAGGFKQPLNFMQSDVAASQNAVALDVLGLVGNTEFVMPYPGSVIAISVGSNDARTAGTLTVDVTIDGVVTGLQVVLDDDPTTYAKSTQAKDTDTFTALQRIGVKITTDGDWAPITADIVVTVIVEL